FGDTEVRDIPAVVAYALGLEQPEAWSAHLPNGLFRDAPKQARKEESFNGGRKKYSDRANLPTPTDKKSLGNYIDLSHALCYYPLDDNLKDEITSSEAKANGKLYFTQGFYGSSATLDDCVVNGQGIDVGTNDFSFCAWIKKPEAEDNEKWCVFSTKDDENGCDLGFAFLTHQMELEARIGLGNETIGFWRAMPINYADNFFHFICTVSRKTNRIAFYYDFEKDIESQPERPIPNGLSLTRDAVHFGNHTPLTLDDLLVFDHALTTEEIQNLKAYYEQK
ncbi:MAG TPA: hypothetical protein DDY98_00180, partial [Ruminococcaceae bacterium]|nr:hypothetical protein [Oscillospiraceae bacterium]